MRLTNSLAIGAAALLSATALADDKKADAPASPGSKQSPAAPAANEATINLKVTGMT